MEITFKLQLVMRDALLMCHQNLQKSTKTVNFRPKNCYFKDERILPFYLIFCHFIRDHIFMFFTGKTFKSSVWSALASSLSGISYVYECKSNFHKVDLKSAWKCLKISSIFMKWISNLTDKVGLKSAWKCLIVYYGIIIY